MNRLIFILLILSTIVLADGIKVKSLKSYIKFDETTFPVIVESDEGIQGRLIIEFDVEAELEPQLKISFKFCDLDWKPYDNYFLSNEGYNVERNLWFETLGSNFIGADFHYKGEFPNNDITFPFSGNWIYIISDSHDDELIYEVGKFFVVKKEIDIHSSIKTFQLEGAKIFPRELAKTFELNTVFHLKDDMFDNRVLGVQIIENRRIDEPYWVDRYEYDELSFYEWDASKNFKFVRRDIMPGNEYRTADLRDHNRFSAPETFAQIDRIETQKFYKKRPPDLDGSSVFTKNSNSYAQYLDVIFNFKPNLPFGKRIFLVGAFNNWLVSPEYELKSVSDIFSVEVNLKRGMYDYQYVSAEGFEDDIYNIDFYELEGNFWNTNNEYNVFVYYKSEENGEFDKIIGYTKIYSKGR